MNHNATNMNEQALLARQEKTILIISSHILSYPPESVDELAQDIKLCIEEEMGSGTPAQELKNACEQLFRYQPKELRELYVSTFDLRSKLGLYLTAHEFGDSPKRGAALIKLQKTINKAGFERIDEELADFIPMLLELLAVSPESADQIRLYKRLSIVIHRMLKNINRENPYSRILLLLVDHVFPKPTEEEVTALENNREEADLEELPFPIMYQ